MTPASPGAFACVALGGALGSLARYATGLLLVRAWPAAVAAGLPLGAVLATLAVNALGSLLIGLFGGAVAGGWAAPASARLLLVTGVLGGFTTFSAFALDAGLLWGRAPALAVLYVGATLALGLCAFALGFALARWLAK